MRWSELLCYSARPSARLRFCYFSLVLVSALGILSGCVAQVASNGDDAPGTAADDLTLYSTSLSTSLQTTTTTSTLSTSIAQPSCARLNGYTAALANALLACEGTIGPRSFYTNAEGHLRRAFDKCSLPFQGDATQKEDTRLQTVDDILGIQSRSRLAATCIPGQWEAWRKRFLGAGNYMCPFYALVVGKLENDPSPENVKMSASTLPTLSRKEGLPDEKATQVVAGDEHGFYKVSFAGVEPFQPCGSAQSCAKECAGGLPGGFVRYEGDYVVMDPLWWLTDYLYPDPATNPFMSYDYYHPMSFEGDLPGHLYGHINRAGELCSLYMGGDHYLGMLAPHCLVQSDLRSCMSLCSYY